MSAVLKRLHLLTSKEVHSFKLWKMYLSRFIVGEEFEEKVGREESEKERERENAVVPQPV